MSIDFERRANGWLHFLASKLSMPDDDWSHNGSPSPAWDNMSGAPTTNWYRFDAIGVATTLALAALSGTLDNNQAAQWIDGIVDRMRQYHGFNEWVEQRWSDPGREDYPTGWKGTLIPDSLWGDYDTPGWARNGSQPNGHESNPIEAQGAIYFKGFFNFVLGLRALLDSTVRGDEPIEIVYDDEIRYTYSHTEINSILASHFRRSLDGASSWLCCEIDKLWPL